MDETTAFECGRNDDEKRATRDALLSEREKRVKRRAQATNH